MTMQTSGPISMGQILAELKMSNATATNIDKTELRNLAKIAGTQTTIKFSDFYGKSSFAFSNGGFEGGTLVVNGDTVTLPGWVIYNRMVRLNGLDTILGWPTPIDNTPLPYSSVGDDNLSSSMTFTTSFATDIPATSGNTRSLQLNSTGTAPAFGIVHGPYAVNDTSVDCNVGDIVTFWWKAQGGSDAYDIFAYLLDTTAGKSIVLVNETANSGTASTPWTKVSHTIQQGEQGSYKFVFVSGTYDASGGTALGANLYIDNVDVIKP